MYSQSMNSEIGTTSIPITALVESLPTVRTVLLVSEAVMAELALYLSELTDRDDV